MTVLPDVDYYLVLNSVPLDTYGWRVLSYDDLLSGPVLRGDDVVMPTAAGVRPYPRRIDVAVRSLSVVVDGRFDEDGDPYDDPFEGMIVNRDYLRANLGIGLTTGDGTVPAVFNRGDLTDLAGDVTVLAMSDWQTVAAREGFGSFRLDLSIPDGELAESGS
jgi:hypothetical protein